MKMNSRRLRIKWLASCTILLKSPLSPLLSLRYEMSLLIRLEETSGRLALLVLLSWILLVPTTSRAQDSLMARPLPQISEAIAHGDAKALFNYATERVEINMFGANTVYSPGQAVYVVHDFFQRYPPSQFDFRDVSRSEQDWFAEGIYRYKGGKGIIRIYLRLRNAEKQWQLREIHIGHRDDE